MNPLSSNTEIEQLNKELQSCKKFLVQYDERFLPTCHALVQQAEKGGYLLMQVKAKLLLGEYYLIQRKNEEHLELIAKLLHIAEENHFQKQTAEAALQWAFCRYVVGDFSDKTVALFNKTIEICKILEEGDIKQILGKAYLHLGMTYEKRAEIDKAIEYYEKNISLLADGIFLTPVLTSYMGLATIYQKRMNVSQTFFYINKALPLAQKIDDWRNVCMCYSVLSGNYFHLKDYEKAHHFIDKAIEIESHREDTYNFLHHYSKGLIYQEEKNTFEALKCFEKVLAIASKAAKKDVIAESKLAIGKTKRIEGKFDDAIEWIQEALDFYETNQLRGHIALCQLELGVVYNQLQNYPTAVELLEKALSNTLFPREKAQIFLQLAEVYEGLGEWKKSQQSLKNFMQTHEDLYGDKTKQLLDMQHQYVLSIQEKEMEILQLKHQELEEMDELKSRFFTHISHELRTPLTLILGPTEALLKEKHQLQDHQIQHLQVIRRNGKSMLQLIEEVLTLSKLNVNKLTLEEAEFSLYPTIKRIFQTFQSAAHFKKQDYHLSFWVDRELTVRMDLNKLEKILNNLFSNAIKYTPESGEILVLVEKTQDGYLQLKVKDSGRGVHPEDLPHIFAPYFQSHQKNLLSEGGVGIGLALVKELVELMGGSITVESKWKKGSVFVLQLPLNAVDVSKIQLSKKYVSVIDQVPKVFTKNPSSIHQASSEHLSRILIVEDHAEMRQYLFSILAANYQIQAAQNGLEAWKLLQQENHGIDLILSDVMMPKMDGFTLVEKIKNTPNLLQLPIVLLTARAHSKDKLKALTMGIDDYLLKPFAAEELLVRIQNLLQKRTKSAAKNTPPKQQSSSTISATPSDLQWLRRVEEKFKKELDNTHFTLMDLANELNMSKRQLQRRIRKITQLTPNQYVREIRLQTAKQCLETGTYETLSEVAYAVGFNTSAYFAKIYQQRFGKHPSTFFSL